MPPTASPNSEFRWPVRVYWEDTDAGGIVFYANYLKFFERSRTEWLRSLGIEQQRLKDSTGGMFVVLDTRIRYHRPARLDDELIVTASMVETGRASMIIKQQALSKTEQNDLPGRNLGDRHFSDGPPLGKLAPKGLTAAAPSLPAQAWTDGRAAESLSGTSSTLRAAKSAGATLLCEGTIRIGWVDAASLRPTRIPASILSRFPS
ncbi:MAG TPA: YbgC/FadM family acyl-CoA thioesterase [Polaromonas sp.]